jgi:hypothetical protein
MIADDILQELVEAYENQANTRNDKEDDEFTITEFQQVAHIGREAARQFLHKQAEAGKLAERRCVVNGVKCLVFRKV